MWRFMLVTFAFLGWSFYQLSGGSDYAPVANSIQARATDQTADTPAVQVASLTPAADIEDDSADVTRAATLTDLTTTSETTDDSRFQITLTSVSSSEAVMPTVTSAEPEVTETIAASYDDNATDAVDKAVADALAGDVNEASSDVSTWSENGVLQTEVFSLETYSQAVDNGTLMASSTAVSASQSTDYRQVSGNVVNMRAGPGTEFQAVGTVNKGAEIVVLDEPGNGWLMLEVVETGETGWMADWLVTASN